MSEADVERMERTRQTGGQGRAPDGGGKGVERAVQWTPTDGWTGPTRCGQKDGQKRLGRADWRTGGRMDEEVGLGLKGAIPPPHFTLGRPIRLPC